METTSYSRFHYPCNVKSPLKGPTRGKTRQTLPVRVGTTLPPHGYAGGTLQCSPAQSTGVQGPAMHLCCFYPAPLLHSKAQSRSMCPGGVPAQRLDTSSIHQHYSHYCQRTYTHKTTLHIVPVQQHDTSTQHDTLHHTKSHLVSRRANTKAWYGGGTHKTTPHRMTSPL